MPSSPYLLLLLIAGQPWIEITECQIENVISETEQMWSGQIPRSHLLHTDYTIRSGQEVSGVQSWSCKGYLVPQQVTAALHLLTTVSTSQVHIAFQEEADGCLIQVIWMMGVGVRVTTGEWVEMALKTWSSYTQTAQHIVVGELSWILSILRLVKQLYTENKLNSMTTHWFWVVIAPPKSEQSSNATQKPSGIGRWNATNLTQSGHEADIPQSSFRTAMKDVSRFVTEGMRGLLIYPLQQPPKRMVSSATNYSNSSQIWASVGGVKAVGDGPWRLKQVARWKQGKFFFLAPLWPDLPQNLQGRTIRLSCISKLSVFEFVPGDRLSDAVGYTAHIVREVQERLNFTDVIIPTVGFGSASTNGTWNGMIGVLTRGEADIAPLDFTPLWQRALVIDFGIIYNTDNLVIISKAPSIIIKPFLLFQIFSPTVWVSVIAVAVIAGLAMYLLLRAHKDVTEAESAREHDATRTHVNVLVYCSVTLKILVFQSSDWWPQWAGCRVVSGCFMFLSLVVGALYSGSITALLAIPFRSLSVDSLEELAATSITPAVWRDSSTHTFFLRQDTGALGEVKKRMKPLSGAELSQWEFMSDVADGTYAVIDTASSILGRSNKYQRRGEPCLFHVAKNPVMMDLDAFAFPKNSPIRHQFDYIMRWMRYYGILQKIQKQYFAKSCSALTTSDNPTPLNLNQVQGAFYILGCGLVACLLILVMEIVYAKRIFDNN